MIVKRLPGGNSSIGSFWGVGSFASFSTLTGLVMLGCKAGTGDRISRGCEGAGTEETGGTGASEIEVTSGALGWGMG